MRDTEPFNSRVPGILTRLDEKVWPPRTIRVRFEVCCVAAATKPAVPDMADPTGDGNTKQSKRIIEAFQNPAVLPIPIIQQQRMFVLSPGKRGLERCPKLRVQYSDSGQGLVD